MSLSDLFARKHLGVSDGYPSLGMYLGWIVLVISDFAEFGH